MWLLECAKLQEQSIDQLHGKIDGMHFKAQTLETLSDKLDEVKSQSEGE